MGGGREFENSLYEVEEGILTITLNRPEILNAFSGGMLRDITEAFDRPMPMMMFTP